jgi:hypothetical protein
MLQVSMATNANMFTSMEDRALLDAAKHLVIEEHLATTALLRHVVPSGDAAEIFDRAVTLLVDQHERQRFAQTERPRVANASLRPSRHIPAAVRRAVWRRDGGCCAFVGAEGRCGERAFLELHHVEPSAVGGAATVENIELRCRAHNAYEARSFFGPDIVREERAWWC